MQRYGHLGKLENAVLIEAMRISQKIHYPIQILFFVHKFESETFIYFPR